MLGAILTLTAAYIAPRLRERLIPATETQRLQEEIGNLKTELDARDARLRQTERQLEALRSAPPPLPVSKAPLEEQPPPPSANPTPAPEISTPIPTSTPHLRMRGDIGASKANDLWRISIQNGAFAETPEKISEFLGSGYLTVGGSSLFLPEGHQALLLRLGLEVRRFVGFGSDSGTLEPSNFILVDHESGDRLDPFHWNSVGRYSAPPQAQ